LAKHLKLKKIKFFIIVVVSIMISSAIPLPDFVMQSNQDVYITSPAEGQVLSGVVDIIGTNEITGFSHSELAFSNAIGSMETWFPLSNTSNSVKADLLFAWDTTHITDGDYRLRLRVFSEDDSISEFLISIITIRNYSQTTIPSISATSVLLDPTSTILSATETPLLRPTLLPENPLALSSGDLAKSLIFGILTILGLIGISIIYSRGHRK